MKTLALLISLLITALIANAQDTKGVTLTVTIENVASNEGQILTALHTQDTFMKGPGIQNFKKINSEKNSQSQKNLEVKKNSSYFFCHILTRFLS